MKTKVIKNHPSLNNIEQRFEKTKESIVASFQIEGIYFTDDDLKTMVRKIEADIKK